MFYLKIIRMFAPLNLKKTMIQQTTFLLSARRRGFHLVTREILEHLPKPLPQTGLLNLFVQHTSCALSINENADPDVRGDLEKVMNCLVSCLVSCRLRCHTVIRCLAGGRRPKRKDGVIWMH